MRKKTVYVSPAFRALVGLVLVIIGLLFLAMLAIPLARSIPIDEGKQWSSRIPATTLMGTYATSGFLRGGV